MYILYFSAHTPDICIRFNEFAMTKINNNREIGKALFLSGYSQRDIAARIGVSENTVGRWARDGHWDDLREAQRTSKPSVLKDLYAELAEMNRVIQTREDGKRFATKDEALTRSRLVKNIADLEQRYSLGNAVDMGRDFCTFVGTTDYALARQVLEHWDAFINELIKRQQDGNID